MPVFESLFVYFVFIAVEFSIFVFFFFFKQKTAYEMRISDWSSDVCSSDLPGRTGQCGAGGFFCSPPELRDGGDPSVSGLCAGFGSSGVPTGGQIGRASCRERVCQYV